MAGVRRVTAVSTGTVKLRPEHERSTGMPLLWWLLTSRRWTAPRPINVYVIEHEQGVVLFDAGQDRASVTDPAYFPGGAVGFLYHRLARFEIGPDQTLQAGLAAHGLAFGDVRKVVLSHLHQDHIGALGDFGEADIYVCADERQTLGSPFALMNGLMTKHIELPELRWNQVRFSGPPVGPFAASFDLMGDGSVLLLPTPGHTPGSMSLLLPEMPGDPLLFVGDLTYSCDLLHAGDIPGVGNARRLRESASAVRLLEQQFPKLRILAAHDPGAAQSLLDSGNAA